MSDQSTYLLWILRQKNWTNFSLFSSWSSMNLKQRNVMITLNTDHPYGLPCTIFFISLPGGGSFAKEFHETTLHHQPEASRHVKDDGKEDEVQGDPLVIRVVHNCVITVVLKASHELLKRKSIYLCGDWRVTEDGSNGKNTRYIYFYIIFILTCETTSCTSLLTSN